MTRADYVTLIRTRVADDSADAGTITTALNDAVNDLCTNNRLRLMETSDQLFAALGDFEMDLPDDIDKVIPEGFYATSPSVVKMAPNKLEYERFMPLHPNYATATAANVGDWCIYGSTVRFATPLASDYEFTLDYLRNPVPVADDTDVLEIPDRYSELVSFLGAARYQDMIQQHDEADTLLARAEPLRVNFIRNEARGMASTGGYVLRQNRRGWRNA